MSEDCLEEISEGSLTDEEGKGLVLVGRPGVELGEEEGGDSQGCTGDSKPERPPRKVIVHSDRG